MMKKSYVYALSVCILFFLYIFISNKEKPVDEQIEIIMSKSNQVQNDLSTLKQIIEKIFIENHRYLEMWQSLSINDSYIVIDNKKMYLKNMGYAIPNDPFNDKDRNYHYYQYDNFYIVSSYGPDLDDDLANMNILGKVQDEQNVHSLIRSIIYDVSNGLQSNGDIILYGP